MELIVVSFAGTVLLLLAHLLTYLNYQVLGRKDYTRRVFVLPQPPRKAGVCPALLGVDEKVVKQAA